MARIPVLVKTMGSKSRWQPDRKGRAARQVRAVSGNAQETASQPKPDNTGGIPEPVSARHAPFTTLYLYRLLLDHAMIVYVACAAGVHEEEVDLIRRVARFEGMQFSIVLDEHPELVRRYYKGGRPAVIVTNEFLDIEVTKGRYYAKGFYGFVSLLQNEGLCRC